MVSPPTPKHSPFESVPAESIEVRVISSHPDPYAGLKGHAYIQARGLNSPIQRVQTSAQNLNAAATEVRK